MENLNPKIFEQTIILWKSTLTRGLFPKTYQELKTHIINEYLAQMTDPERAKVIANVIKHATKNPGTELSMQTQENNNKEQKGKCFICGNKNRKMKKCWYYNADKSVEENKKIRKSQRQK